MRFEQGILLDEEEVEVNRTPPHLDECKNLLLHVIKQAVDDYQLFRNKTREDHREIWISASGLLFNDDHYIHWGGQELNLEQICEILSLDINWVRNRVLEQVEVKLGADGTVSTTRRF
jgi:hypothetical protein